MAANSLNRIAYLESENKNLIETLEIYKQKVATLEKEIQILKKGRLFYIIILLYIIIIY